VLSAVRNSYHLEINYVLQNLIDSHDTDRLVSMILNPDRNYDDHNGLRGNPDYNIAKPDASARQIQKLIALFQMMYLGAPMIYYGTESGMWGADDPDDRKPMLWSDLRYDDEKSHPISDKSRSRDKNVFDKELFAHYKKVIAIRERHDALTLGDFKTLVADNEKDVYIFQRTYKNDVVVVALNNSEKKQEISFNFESGYKDELNGTTYGMKGGKSRFCGMIQPKWGCVLVKQGK
jgi:glycosidase